MKHRREGISNSTPCWAVFAEDNLKTLMLEVAALPFAEGHLNEAEKALHGMGWVLGMVGFTFIYPVPRGGWEKNFVWE